MEFNLKSLVRPNIWGLEPYKCARSEFSGQASVWLDANESAFNEPYNRYPDPLQREVKQRLSAIKGVEADRIFLGVGSDECIDMVYRVFCRPGVDRVVAIAPSYGMYEVCADVNDVQYTRVPLLDDFSLDLEALRRALPGAKVLWLCSPNNPTGNAFPVDEMVALCRDFAGIVVVDEAYIDFSGQPSMTAWLSRLPNLVVLQTLSKAWGSAAVRLGIAYASPEIIGIFNKVKYPYNVSLLAQQYALRRLAEHAKVQAEVGATLQRRAALIDGLRCLPQVLHICRTDANFVLVRVTDADGIYVHLRDRGIIVRNRNSVEKCLGCLRITVGTQNEDDELIKAIEDYGRK